MNRMSPSSRLVSRPARSPAFSTTGPEVTRTCLPSSWPRMKARVVLPRPGGAAEQDVVQGLAAAFGGADHDLEALDGPGLSGEVRKRQRPQRGLDGGDGGGEGARDESYPGRRGGRGRRDFRFSILDFGFRHGKGGQQANGGWSVIRKSKFENRKSPYFHSSSAPRLRRFSTKRGWARLMISALRTTLRPGIEAATMVRATAARMT